VHVRARERRGADDAGAFVNAHVTLVSVGAGAVLGGPSGLGVGVAGRVRYRLSAV
jgi:hypothetical protein